jgi:RNA polymerase sigma factor (sigma-70 family)
MGSADEQVLIDRAKRGDDKAYERLLAPLVEPAHKLACGLLHDSHLAEDAVQDASVKAWRKLRNLKDGAPMRPWFLAIVANQCRDVRRGHWSRLVLRHDVSEQIGPAEDEALRRVQVRQALERLNKQERLVVVLHFYLDLPWPDVAAITGLTEAGARSRLNRALARIRPPDRSVVIA